MKMKRRHFFFLIPFFALSVTCKAQWRIEAESEATRVLLRGDTLDITSPKGLSLWWETPLTAPCTIEYRACVVMEGGPCDRLSDLNCFWMASVPLSGKAVSPLLNSRKATGRFLDSYRLQCYYLGFGGNYNTTTRFRRYDADTLAITDETHRPPIIKEYTDEAHLLKPNHWYSVRIEVHADGLTRYYIDDELLVDYLDPSPLPYGWFAFRTTWSHTRVTGFRVNKEASNDHTQGNEK